MSRRVRLPTSEIVRLQRQETATQASNATTRLHLISEDGGDIETSVVISLFRLDRVTFAILPKQRPHVGLCHFMPSKTTCSPISHMSKNGHRIEVIRLAPPVLSGYLHQERHVYSNICVLSSPTYQRECELALLRLDSPLNPQLPPRQSHPTSPLHRLHLASPYQPRTLALHRKHE